MDLGTALSILADPDGRMSTDHNRTPVEKPQVEGALQECCESVRHCFRNRGCGEDLNEEAELVVVALKNALMLLYWLPIPTYSPAVFGGVWGW